MDVEVLPVRTGRHTCLTSTSAAEYRGMLTAYFEQGLRDGDLLAYFGSPPEHTAPALDSLRAADHDPEQLLDDGSLVIGLADDLFLRDGRFDPDAAIQDCRDLIARATANGYRGVRVVTELSWLAATPSHRASWPEFEFRVDLLTAAMPFTALCCYDKREWEPDELRLIHAVHSDAPAAGDDTTFKLRGNVDGSLGIEGELDFRDADTVRSILLAAASDLTLPVLDISRLLFADVAGMRAIAAAALEFQRSFGRVQIRGASPHFRKVWDLLLLHDLVPKAEMSPW